MCRIQSTLAMEWHSMRNCLHKLMYVDTVPCMPTANNVGTAYIVLEQTHSADLTACLTFCIGCYTVWRKHKANPPGAWGSRSHKDLRLT